MDGQKVLPFRANLLDRQGGAKVSPRVGWLTPTEVDNLMADALWMGAGTRLDVSVPGVTSDSGVAWVRDRFDALCKRGIAVRVRRDDEWSFELPLRATGPRAR